MYIVTKISFLKRLIIKRPQRHLAEEFINKFLKTARNTIKLQHNSRNVAFFFAKNFHYIHKN